MTSQDASTIAELESPASTPFPLKLRLYVMMFLQYFVQGCYLPIISLYLIEALGFDSSQIGRFGMALSVGPLVAPFVLGQLVDRHFATQHVLSVCHFCGGLIMVALYWQQGYWPVILLGTVYSVLYVPSLMVTNSLAFHHLVNRDREFPLVRLWGTIGFVVPAWLIEAYWLRGLEGDELNQGRGIALAFAGVAGMLMGLYSLTLPHTPPPESDARDFAPGKVLGMMRYRHFLVLVLTTFGVAIVHKFYFVWNSPFIKAMLTAGEVKGAWAQRISSIGQIAEVAVMAGLGFAVIRFGFKWTMVAGIVAYTSRCVVFAFAATLGEPFSLVLSLVCFGQALHGFCFGCFLAAAFMYVDRVAPVDIRGSMQNVFGTFVFGLGMFVGGFVSGDIIGEWFSTGEGADAVRDWMSIWLSCAAMAAVCLVGFVLFFPNKPAETEGDAAAP